MEDKDGGIMDLDRVETGKDRGGAQDWGGGGGGVSAYKGGRR